MKLNYYEILGIPFDISLNELNLRYKEILKNSMLYHSDEYKMNLELAFETLSNYDTRKIYDNKFDNADIAHVNDNYARYMKVLNMFDILEENIDEEVIVEYIWCGQLKIAKGKLEDIFPFYNLVVGNRVLPLIGRGTGVVKVINAKTEEVLYSNTNVDVQSFDKTFSDKIKTIAISWGNFIAYQQYDKFLNRFSEDNENKKVRYISL